MPASASTNTLVVYLGGYSSSGLLTATLSDGSSPVFSQTISGTGNYTDVATITYNASAPGQTLTVTYTKSANGAAGAAAASISTRPGWSLRCRRSRPIR